MKLRALKLLAIIDRRSTAIPFARKLLAGLQAGYTFHTYKDLVLNFAPPHPRPCGRRDHQHPTM